MIYCCNEKSFMSTFWEPLGGSLGLQTGLFSWKQPYSLESFNRQSAQQRDLKGFYIEWASKSEMSCIPLRVASWWKEYLFLQKKAFGHLRHTLGIALKIINFGFTVYIYIIYI